MSRLDISGDACSRTSGRDLAVEGGYRQFHVELVGVGICHLTATATDGRQATSDVTVSFDRESCCGSYYETDRHDYTGHGGNGVEITFSGAMPTAVGELRTCSRNRGSGVDIRTKVTLHALVTPAPASPPKL